MYWTLYIYFPVPMPPLQYKSKSSTIDKKVKIEKEVLKVTHNNAASLNSPQKMDNRFFKKKKIKYVKYINLHKSAFINPT